MTARAEERPEAEGAAGRIAGLPGEKYVAVRLFERASPA